MLPTYERITYSGIRQRADLTWPGGRKLAAFVALNLEHFIYGEGGVDLDRASPPPNLRSYLWREYGNRVGVWRLLDLFDELELPVGVIANSEMYDHAPDIMDAFRTRGDEVIGHGRTNSKPLAAMDEAEERALITEVTQTLTEREGTPPKGWLSPYLSPSERTPDLLKEAGYQYVLDFGMADDQPFQCATKHGPLLALPYPIELNDQPAIVFRRDTTAAFFEAAIDQFDEMRETAVRFPGVYALSLHSFVVGQPFRLRHLRRALEYIITHRDDVWLTTPGGIADQMAAT